MSVTHVSQNNIILCVALLRCLLFAIYCHNKADAESFVKENVQVMVTFGEVVFEDPKVGNYNNVAYVGSETSIGYAGFRI